MLVLVYILICGEIKLALRKHESFITVTFQKEGIHCYPAAATDPRLKDVSYLANPHRHMFHFQVYLEVFHEDRDIEFIQFKKYLESLYEEGTLEAHSNSCEMLGDLLAAEINMKYPDRIIIIGVSEDGENGSETSYYPILDDKS